MKSFLLPSKTSRRTTSSPATDSGLAQILFPYGVGVDTHSGFIQACVIWVTPGPDGNQLVKREENEFATEWPQLLAAKAWVLRVLRQLPDTLPPVDPDQLRYCIESTGTYHMPVLLAWRGIPCVVNPLLAGPTRRKTDVLDARLLAHHSITGLWKPSFIPTAAAQELRVIWAERADALRRATRCSNQINNIVLPRSLLRRAPSHVPPLPPVPRPLLSLSRPPSHARLPGHLTTKRRASCHADPRSNSPFNACYTNPPA